MYWWKLGSVVTSSRASPFWLACAHRIADVLVTSPAATPSDHVFSAAPALAGTSAMVTDARPSAKAPRRPRRAVEGERVMAGTLTAEWSASQVRRNSISLITFAGAPAATTPG